VATHYVVLVLKVCVVLLHGRVDGLEGGHQVVEDGRAPRLALRLAKSAGIDDSHLLEHRRLAALAGACRAVLALPYHVHLLLLSATYPAAAA